MRILLLVIGSLVVIGISLDALWTTLWIDGHAGPLTRRHTSLIRRGILRLAGGDHRKLSLTGPIVLFAAVMVWALITWLGWFLVFSGTVDGLLHTHSKVPADWWDRFYYVGYTMVTIGNGDFTPHGSWWEVLTALAGLDGLFVMTLSVTYLLAIIEAVVQKRSFASQVYALGRSAEEFILHAWDGTSFRGLELQIVSITEQLNLVSEQHQAYPMLHYYHEARREQSVSSNLAVYSEALLILRHAVRAEVRPASAAMFPAQRSVESFLETLKNAYIEPADADMPHPELSRLRAAGIPLVPDEEFERKMAERDDRRSLLCGFLESERRPWPTPEHHG